MAKKEQIVINYSTLNFYLLVALLVILAFGFYNVWQINKQIEDLKPTPPVISKIQITVLAAPDCEDCLDISQLTDAVKQIPNTEITEETTLELDAAEEFIEKYNISRLPALLLTGEVENLTLQGLIKMDNALVFAQSPPLYYDVVLERIVGQVEVIFLKDESCAQCSDIEKLIPQFEQVGVKVTKQISLDITDPQAKGFIDTYDIKKVPTILLNSEALVYDIISQVWEAVGSVEDDGRLVLREATPPYKDLENNKVRGIVDVTFITYKACEECYNVSMHKEILEQNFAMVIGSEIFRDVDSVEGKRLVKDYELTLVPTVLLSEEAGVYAAVEQVWEQIGTIEEDGTYVFRNIDKLSGITYKDLSTGELVNATG